MSATTPSRQTARDNGTLGQWLVQAIERFADRVAFIQDQRRVTYRELGASISQAIQYFDALGLKRGDTVAQLCGNRPEVFVIVAAAYIHGLRSVTLHPAAGLKDHIHVLTDAEAKCFIGETAYGERAAALRAHGPQVAHWRSHDPGTPEWPCLGAEAQAFTPQALYANTRPEEVMRLSYTGGTTGRSKGVQLSDRAVLTNTLLWLSGMGLPEGVRYLCPAPISHGAGSLVVATLVRGGTVILQRGFDAARFVAGAQTHQAQLTWLVPTMLYGLLDHLRAHPQQRMPSLQWLVYSAAPAAPERLREALQRLGPVLYQSYGQTEAPNTILMLDRADHAAASLKRLSAAGRPYPGLTVALLDEQEREVGAGEIGEICVQGPLLMSGYLNQPEQSAETLRNGWLHTGDLGRRDSDGLYYIVGRKKDMIISGGFNVYPREVEDTLAQHPAVSAAAVFGVPHPKWGEAVTAAVVLRAPAQASAAELIDFVRQHKGPVCAPKTVHFIDAIPLTAIGKPDKKTLADRFPAATAGTAVDIQPVS
ncbi:MAG: AMP-binding protein [Burkholderiaceae bacterium]|jgi:fatty-acyl-CoA synthase|nr:AMP-binding protein [Burkholderiaceae bacterium]